MHCTVTCTCTNGREGVLLVQISPAQYTCTCTCMYLYMKVIITCTLEVIEYLLACEVLIASFTYHHIILCGVISSCYQYLNSTCVCLPIFTAWKDLYALLMCNFTLYDPLLYMCVHVYMLAGVVHEALCLPLRATPKCSFVDYIRGGCQISLIVAVDFTVSVACTCTRTTYMYV